MILCVLTWQLFTGLGCAAIPWVMLRAARPRPAPARDDLDEFGLVGAIERRLPHLRTADGRPLAVALDAPGPMPAVPAVVEVAAYRFVTDALTDLARQTDATGATVVIALTEGGSCASRFATGAVRPQSGTPRSGTDHPAEGVRRHPSEILRNVALTQHRVRRWLRTRLPGAGAVVRVDGGAGGALE